MELTEEIKEYLSGVDYFITGSKRFGTANQDSDIDICVVIHERHKLLERANTVHNFDITEKGPSVKESDYNNGFKFKLNEQEINIIPLHPLDYTCWYHAASLMDATPMKEEKSRMALHGLHETYIGLMKSHFCMSGIGKDNYNIYTDGKTTVKEPLKTILTNDLPF